MSPEPMRPRGKLAVTIAPFVAGVAMLVLALLLGSGRPSAAPPAPATLKVFTRLIASGTAFTEGAVDFVTIEGEGGRVIWNEKYILLTDADPPLEHELPAGVYVMGHYQRPCNLSCDLLGPRVDVCQRRLELPPGATVEATVNVTVGIPCSIEVLNGP